MADAPKIWALSCRPGMSWLLGAPQLALDSREDDPPEEAIGQTIALCSLSMVLGVAKLSGIVYTTRTDPKREHPHADAIRRDHGRSRSARGPVVCVWEAGTLFGEPIPIKVSAALGRFFTLPERVRPELRAAFIAARGRRSA